ASSESGRLIFHSPPSFTSGTRTSGMPWLAWIVIDCRPMAEPRAPAVVASDSPADVLPAVAERSVERSAERSADRSAEPDEAEDERSALCELLSVLLPARALPVPPSELFACDGSPVAPVPARPDVLSLRRFSWPCWSLLLL